MTAAWKKTLRFFLLPTHHVTECFVLEPLEQRCFINSGIERGSVGFPAVRRALDPAAPVASALKPVDAVPREQRPAVARYADSFQSLMNWLVLGCGSTGRRMNRR